MRAPPAQAPPRFSRTGTRGQEPVAGAFAGDRYPGRVPKGAACEVAPLRAAAAGRRRKRTVERSPSRPGLSLLVYSSKRLKPYQKQKAPRERFP